MKLQKQKVRKSGDKEYFKFVLLVPPDRVRQLGWAEGIELREEVKKNSLVVSPFSNEDIKIKREEPIYNNFQISIKTILERHPAGLTWTQIRDKLNYAQKSPNNKWVRMLEGDIGLVRIKRGKNMVWKLEHDTIYTIGYEGLALEQFVKRLKSCNVEQLIDVREIALSRKNGFSRTPLSKALKEVGIRYKHLRSLGSPSNLRHKLKNSLMTLEDYKQFFNEYEKHIKDLEIQDSITEVEGLSKMKKTVLLCFEKDHKTCHRSIIAEELNKRGWKIGHL